MRGLAVRMLAAAALGCAAPVAAMAAPPAVTVELNKLEDVAGGCRSYIVASNGAGAAVDSLSLDLVAFDAGGVIARRLAVELGPLEAGRTRVKVFEMDGLACADISRILVNDILSCAPEMLAGAACAEGVRFSARGPVELVR